MTTTTQAAALLGLSPSYTAALAQQGRIAATKSPEGHWVFRRPLKVLPAKRSKGRPRQPTEATARALKLVRQGATPFAAARQAGIAPNTMYRALARQRAAGK